MLTKREDGRLYWVKDSQGRTFIRGRHRLKAFSQCTDSIQETSNNHIYISISKLTMAWPLNDRTLKAKLRRLPASVVCLASHKPLQIQQEKLRSNTSICVFYLLYEFQPKTKFHSTDCYNFNRPKGIEPFLQHYIVSSDALLSSGSNGITSGHVVPERSIRSQNSFNGTGVSGQLKQLRAKTSKKWAINWDRRITSAIQRVRDFTSSKSTKEQWARCWHLSSFSDFSSAAWGSFASSS